METLQMIVPCFNESESIKPFYSKINEVFSSMNGFDCSLIFVDDGSRDGTLDQLRLLAENDSKVKYISFSRNFGKEGAMLAGLKYSTADYVGIIDADLQHDPALIPEMLNCIVNEGFDVAAAKRSDRKGENAAKRVLSKAFYKFSNAMTTIEIDEGAQDFRLMRRAVVESIISLSETERFTKGIFAFVGFKTKWIEHANSERVAGQSKWSIRSLFRYAANGVISFSNLPLKIPLWVGLIFTVISGVYGIILLCEPTWLRTTPTRRIGTMVFFVGGIILICIGIVSQYIARIYTEVKARPAYIVSETNITP